MKLSLLASLGIIPIACGGTYTGAGDGGRGGVDPGETGMGGRGGRGGVTPPRGTAGTDPTPAGSGNLTGGYGGTGVVVTGGAGGTGPIGALPLHCTSPKLDPQSGLVLCAEGYSHRPKATVCAVTGDDTTGIGGAGGGGSDAPNPRALGDIQCSSDADCRGFELGYCGGGEGLPSVCESGCVSDADCGAGAVCVCNGSTDHGGECQPARCRTDQDCGANSLCGSYHGPCGSDGFACFLPYDQCRTDQDCNGSACDYDFIPQMGYGGAIAIFGRACSDAVCGRPFLVDDEARVAPVEHRGDWCSRQQPCPETAHLSDAERASLAQHWTRMGQMEHASIAAFARFSLQLLALGAPPELVEASTRALQDETEHAQLCFALASAYAGHAIGPAALDLSNSLGPTTLAEIVELVITEGCFGETSAALDAFDAADTASDPVIRSAYSRIARDEQRHAELAFRFVRWALLREPGIAASVRAAIVAERAVSAAVQDVVETCLYGVLARREAA